jgi:hypothetical protein
MKNNSLHKGVLRGLIALFLLLSLSVSAQSLTGTRGLIKAPTARMYESGTLAIGMGYVPAKFFKRTYGNYKGLRTGNSGLNTFITTNILPFMEIMFRYSHELNMKVSPNDNYFPDRMFTARFKILNENKHRPSILIGLQDITSLLSFSPDKSSNYSATYIVFSKKEEFKNINIDFSLGYAPKFNYIKFYDFYGIFGGIEIQSKILKNTQFLLEYDSSKINFGFQKFIFNRLHTNISLMDFKPMFILAYRYKI